MSFDEQRFRKTMLERYGAEWTDEEVGALRMVFAKPVRPMRRAVLAAFGFGMVCGMLSILALALLLEML